MVDELAGKAGQNPTLLRATSLLPLMIDGSLIIQRLIHLL